MSWHTALKWKCELTFWKITDSHGTRMQWPLSSNIPFFLFFFPKCPNTCKAHRNKMLITSETLIPRKSKVPHSHWIHWDKEWIQNVDFTHTTQNTCADFWKHTLIALQGIKPAFLAQPIFPDWNNSFRCYFCSRSVLLC